MPSQRRVPFLVGMGLGVLLAVGCRARYSYGVGFVSCSDVPMEMAAVSATYRSPFPMSLRKGQIKGEGAVHVAIPEQMTIRWSANGGVWNAKTYEVATRLPSRFDIARDHLWFVSCSEAPPLAIAEVGSLETGFAIYDLQSGQSWKGSIHTVCGLCAATDIQKHGCGYGVFRPGASGVHG